MSDPPLQVDPARTEMVDETGIYVRAMRGDKPGNYDIAHLDYASLMRWLRSSDGVAERTVALLLGHREEPQ